jgi:hypothetical protein
MKNLLIVIVLLLVIIAGVGFYRGWFHFSTVSTDHNSNATITVDKDKIHVDEEKVKEKVQDLGRKAK